MDESLLGLVTWTCQWNLNPDLSGSLNGLSYLLLTQDGTPDFRILRLLMDRNHPGYTASHGEALTPESRTQSASNSI